MNVGMLWFDNSKNTLTVKIQKAVEYYYNKYGRRPDLCLVHPKMLVEKIEIAGLVVRPYHPVLPGHIWIGIEEMPVAPEGSKV